MKKSINFLRGALALAFLYFGLRKLVGYHVDVAIYEAIGFGQFPRYITGTVEVTGALLLWKRGLEGFAALLLLATVTIGLCALLLWVGPPYWHMIALIIASSTMVGHHRRQILQLMG
ncbi:hypothetical protein [Yoonia sediminilitoris]|nr:hypothetical protein [Yoonia sediminilitoris]